MKNVKALIYLFNVLLVLCFISCEEEEGFPVILPDDFLGTWNVEYTNETYRQDTLFSVSGFDFQLSLNKEGTGSYGFPSVDQFIDLEWSMSYNEDIIFITLLDSFDTLERRQLNYRFDVLERESDRILLRNITQRGVVGEDFQTEFWYWDMVK